jgi:hypothetical protein
MRMIQFLSLVAHILVSPFKTRVRLEAEIILLRHQVNVLRRRLPAKPRLTLADRLVFIWLYRLFPSVRSVVTIIQPETVVRWHRAGFHLYGRWKSRSRGCPYQLSHPAIFVMQAAQQRNSYDWSNGLDEAT